MEDRYVTTSQGVKLRYVTGGSGPPLVIVHALQMIASADTWSKHFELFGRNRTFYALDTPGWGFSDLLDDYDFETWIAALKGFCDALGLQQVDILAQSLGSWISQLYAWRYPERVRAIAALGSPGANPALPGRARTLNAAMPTLESLLRDGYDDRQAGRILQMMDRPGKWENWERIYTYLNTPHVRDEWTLTTRLPGMQTPILYGNWDTNTAIPPRYTFELFNLAPNARLEITSGPLDDLFAPSMRFIEAETRAMAAK